MVYKTFHSASVGIMTALTGMEITKSDGSALAYLVRALTFRLQFSQLCVRDVWKCAEATMCD